MNDYVHEKVVRLPFPKSLLERNGSHPDDSIDYLEDILKGLWDNGKEFTFKLEYTTDACYIDWCYYHTYGYEPGEWGNVRLLTKKELEVIKPLFDKLGCEYNDNDLRVVDYCYYNGCEPADYYAISEDGNDESEFFLERNKRSGEK